jgi:hypothetical protein
MRQGVKCSGKFMIRICIDYHVFDIIVSLDIEQIP